jgi:DNA-binding transcriptional LysR family regulator
MFTIKQLEALYWVATLGSFEAAADYLNMAQSTISKRIGELEARFPVPLFHRTGRRSVLTSGGEEVREIAEQILRLTDRLGAMAKHSAAPAFRFRLGVTDLVALSWLPDLLDWIARTYPTITMEPEIDLTAALLEKLADRRLDFAICPRIIQQPQLVNVPLGAIELVWMASPQLLGDRRRMTVAELSSFPLLLQSAGSILRPVLAQVVDDPSVRFRRTISCNNMAALAHLAAHGMGVTVLPQAFFRGLINDGKLAVIETDRTLPTLEYFATFRNDYHLAFCRNVAETCIRLCNFEDQLSDPRP